MNGARPRQQPLTRQPQPDEDQRAAQERQVRFNNRARQAEFDPDDIISPQRTTRSKTQRSNVPVPDFKLPSAPLERNPVERNEAMQILDQYRRQQREAQRQQPPRQEPQN